MSASKLATQELEARRDRLDGAPDACALDCQVFDDWTALEPMRRHWDALVTRAGDIHSTYDWCRTWWRYYGQRYELRVLVFWRGDDWVGLLPMMIDRMWLGPVRLRMAKLLGSEFTTGVLTPPVRMEYAEAVYAEAMRRLLIDERCDAIRFSPLSGEFPHREHIRRACGKSAAHACLVRDRELDIHSVFQLPQSYDAYLASLSHKRRAALRRNRRRLEEQYKAVLEVVDDPAQIDKAFDQFLALHQVRWQAENKRGHFGDNRHALEFNRDLLRAMAPQGRVWITRVLAEGQPIASEYCFALGDGLYWRLPGRQMGEPWDDLSLGQLSLVYLLQACMERGIRRVEGGMGHYAYKKDLGAAELPVGSLVVAANRPWSVFKSGTLLRLWWRLLNELYIHVWFLKIAPRLPAWLRGPLWHVWVRARI